jgi:ATP-binding cassette subfamily B protein
LLKKIFEYAGEYKNKAYGSVIALLASAIVNMIPYFFVYEIIMYLIGENNIGIQGLGLRIAGIAICTILYALLYIKGLDLSHACAYHALENIRISLQSKIENQPLGTIQDKGAGALKKMFTDDVESIEILLAHSLPE